MRRRWTLFGAGAACLLAGGMLLAFSGDAGTLWGTSLGILGVGVIGWGGLVGRADET